jgi:hypothetical protein
MLAVVDHIPGIGCFADRNAICTCSRAWDWMHMNTEISFDARDLKIIELRNPLLLVPL